VCDLDHLNDLPLGFWTTTTTTHKGRVAALEGDMPPAPPPQPPTPPAVTTASGLPRVASAAARARAVWTPRRLLRGAPPAAPLQAAAEEMADAAVAHAWQEPAQARRAPPRQLHWPT